jgi:uncharacterized OB-fold protein
MATFTCSNCGAEMVEGQRFCRKCGFASNLEAETRELEQQRPLPLATEPVGRAQTSPTVFTPGAMFGTPASVPQVVQPPEHSRTPVLIVGALIGVLVILLVAFGAFLAYRSFVTPQPVVFQPPPVPTAPPSVPAAPEAPPSPPPPPNIAASLRYPGSEVVMDMFEGRKRVMNLRTRDSVETVTRWYEAKLGKAKKVDIVGMAVLQGDGTSVVIRPEATGTNIIVSHEPK